MDEFSLAEEYTQTLVSRLQKYSRSPVRKKKFAQTKIKISNCYQDHWKFQLIKTLMNIKRERERERPNKNYLFFILYWILIRVKVMVWELGFH